MFLVRIVNKQGVAVIGADVVFIESMLNDSFGQHRDATHIRDGWYCCESNSPRLSVIINNYIYGERKSKSKIKL